METFPQRRQQKINRQEKGTTLEEKKMGESPAKALHAQNDLRESCWEDISREKRMRALQLFRAALQRGAFAGLGSIGGMSLGGSGQWTACRMNSCGGS